MKLEHLSLSAPVDSSRSTQWRDLWEYTLIPIVQAGQKWFENFCKTNSEPRITQCTNKYGDLYWKVYDPVRHIATTCGSEYEVRVWLEERYRVLH